MKILFPDTLIIDFVVLESNQELLNNNFMTYTPPSCFTCCLSNITTMIVTGFVTIAVQVNSKPTSSLHVFKGQAHFYDIVLQLMDVHPIKATCEVWLINCVHHKTGVWRFQLEYYLYIG